MFDFVAVCNLNAKSRCEIALQPPVRRIRQRRVERWGGPSWRSAKLSLCRSCGSGGKTPSQGDVIEGEIPDASGRPVGKILLEALVLFTWKESSDDSRYSCSLPFLTCLSPWHTGSAGPKPGRHLESVESRERLLDAGFLAPVWRDFTGDHPPRPGRGNVDDAEQGSRHGWQQVSSMTLEECFVRNGLWPRLSP